eukprot:sb/3467811/
MHAWKTLSVSLFLSNSLSLTLTLSLSLYRSLFDESPSVACELRKNWHEDRVTSLGNHGNLCGATSGTPTRPSHTTEITLQSPITITPPTLPDYLTLLSDTDSTASTMPDVMCRICRSEPGSEKIISPCYCAGSLQYVHQSCLLKWLKEYDCINKHHCELCQYEFKLKPKPYGEWSLPKLSTNEQRRATCFMAVCGVAIFIMIWSINDLLANINMDNVYTNWSFWTKLLFIIFGISILAFQYSTLRYFIVKLRESNQIVLWGEEGEEVGDQKKTVDMEGGQSKK